MSPNNSCSNADRPKEIVTILNRIDWSNLSPFVAVAVSGGADSLALTLLLNDYLKSKDIGLVALTVDHGLRKGSAKEAKDLHTKLTKLEISHHTLVWEPKNTETGLQNKARNARYELMQDWCLKHNINAIFLAHHADDQIETFWLRLLKQSGVDGLSCMSFLRQDNRSGIFFIRPLLSLSKQQLKSLCRYYQQNWFEDPSNKNISFTRNAIRRQIETFPINKKDVLRCIYCFSKLRQALNKHVVSTMKNCVKLHDEGYVTINTLIWKQQPIEIQRHILRNILVTVSGASYPPRSKNLTIAVQKIQNAVDCTSFGCLISNEKEKTFICREPEAIVTQKVSNTPFIWDNRFKISGSDFLKGAIVTTLKSKGLSVLPKEQRKPYISVYKDLPKYVRQSLAVFEKNGEVLSIPQLNYKKSDIKIDFFPKIGIFGTYIKDC